MAETMYLIPMHTMDTPTDMGPPAAVVVTAAATLGSTLARSAGPASMTALAPNPGATTCRPTATMWTLTMGSAAGAWCVRVTPGRRPSALLCMGATETTRSHAATAATCERDGRWVGATGVQLTTPQHRNPTPLTWELSLHGVVQTGDKHQRAAARFVQQAAPVFAPHATAAPGNAVVGSALCCCMHRDGGEGHALLAALCGGLPLAAACW